MGSNGLSIWEWDGRQALPLLNRGYRYMHDGTDSEGQPTFDGQYMRIRTREFFKFFDTSGAPQPLGEWTLHIAPQGVTDLGVRRLHPEVDLIDDLYDRVHRGFDAGDIATHAVIEKLQKIVPRDKSHPYCFLSEATVKGSRLELSTIGDCGEGHQFTFSRAGGKLFVTAMDSASPESKPTAAQPTSPNSPHP